MGGQRKHLASYFHQAHLVVESQLNAILTRLPAARLLATAAAMQFSFASAAAALLTLAAAADLTLYLPPKPNPFTLPANTHATLNSLHHHHSAPLSSVNTFVFRNVTPGESYLFDVYCSEHAYTPLRIDVGLNGDMKAWETYRGNDWANKGEEYPILEGSMGRGVELRFIGAKNYFAERPKCEFKPPP